LFTLGGIPGPAWGQLVSERVATGFTNPVFATSAPGSPATLYVAQKGGQLRLLDTTTGTMGATVLNLATIPGLNFRSAGEQGLLGVAFHPNFTTNRYMYVSYTYDENPNDSDAAGSSRIERYTIAADGTADVASRQTVLEFKQNVFNQTNHKGGWIGFSPRDGYLYMATGDGGGGGDPGANGQNLNTLLGKILRLDVDQDAFPGDATRNYTVPASNPFVGQSGVQEEIWAYGLRNPWRNSFDRHTGDLYIADVGQNAWEEVNFQPFDATGGENYAWSRREGRHAFGGGASLPGDVEPIHEYSHSSGLGRSVTGGYVFRNGLWLDQGEPLDGTYIFGDFVSRRIFTFRYEGSFITSAQERTAELANAVNGGTIGNISSFGEDGFGNVYVLDYFDGEVFRIRGVTAVPEPTALAWFAALGVGGVVWRQQRAKRANEP
jgi:hypothetical protein